MSRRKGETHVLRRQICVSDGEPTRSEMAAETWAVDELARESVGRSENAPRKGWSQGRSTQNPVSVGKVRVFPA